MKETCCFAHIRDAQTGRINWHQLRHLLLLAYWPVFGVLFYLAENVLIAEFYYPIESVLDAYIPFCEWFVIPYVFWFVYMVGMHVYTALFDVAAFRKLIFFVAVTYTTSLVIFAIFPNCQNLRPVEFPRDNFLTDFMRNFYQFDTNTNVLPSLHVVGSFAVQFASRQCPRFRTKGWTCFFAVSTTLISVSTVFLKQHSILDIVAGLLVSAMAYCIVYGSIGQKLAALRSRSKARSASGVAE